MSGSAPQPGVTQQQPGGPTGSPLQQQLFHIGEKLHNESCLMMVMTMVMVRLCSCSDSDLLSLSLSLALCVVSSRRPPQ